MFVSKKNAPVSSAARRIFLRRGRICKSTRHINGFTAGNVGGMPVNEHELLLGWCAIAVFVTGALLAGIRIREWLDRRTWDDVKHTVDPIEEYPQTRLSLRRDK